MSRWGVGVVWVVTDPRGVRHRGSQEPADEFVDQDAEYRADCQAQDLEEDLASQDELLREPEHCFSRARTLPRLRYVPREGRAFFSLCRRLEGQWDSAYLPGRRAAVSTLRGGGVGVPAVD